MRAASFFTVPEAVEIPVIAAESPDATNISISSAARRCGRSIRIWKKALAADRQVAFTTDAGKRYLLQHISNEQLLKRDRSRAVCLEMLKRAGLAGRKSPRGRAELARLDNKPELTVVIDAIRSLDERPDRADASVVFDLVRQLTGRNAAELAGARAELEKLATSARQPILRQIGYVSLINVDKSADQCLAIGEPLGRRRCAILSMPCRWWPMPACGPACIRGSSRCWPGCRNRWPRPKDPRAPLGRYVRIELPRRGTLTLAEVEVTSGGRNVARQGRASQKNTANGGDARRAIDGNTNGEFGAGGQTHTEENTPNPWWEVDLGSRDADRVDQWSTIAPRAIWAIGSMVSRCKCSTETGSEVFRRDGIEAPAAERDLSGQSAPIRPSAIRHAAMLALTYVRGQEAKTFASLRQIRRRRSATGPRRFAHCSAFRGPIGPRNRRDRCWTRWWPTSASLPTQQRTTPEALDALEFAQALAALLPADEAKQIRAELDELGVPRDPRRHAVRADVVRQGHDRRAGRQAGRVHLRELRPDAAQLRDRPAGLAGRDRH